MRIELAPMEGITTYIYRNALAEYYGGVDTYFSPFISTHKDKELNFKEKNEIRAENNSNIKLVPQVLTANADEFLYTSSQIAKYGYDQININFGCPSGTVTTKGKGSGALKDIENLRRLLDDIFSKTDLKVSIKTRIGYENPDEWENLLEIYRQFPIEELIVHARVREDFYNGNARVETLASSDLSGIRFSYNGDIFSVDNYLHIKETFKNPFAVMIGRGIISRPWLAAEIKNNENKSFGIEVFKAFNHKLIDGYDKIMPGEKNTLFKLKELWTYMIQSFDNDKKLLKSIKKCNSLKEYERIIDSLREIY